MGTAWGPGSSKGTVILEWPSGRDRTGDRALSVLKRKQSAKCVPSFPEGKNHLEQLLEVLFLHPLNPNLEASRVYRLGNAGDRTPHKNSRDSICLLRLLGSPAYVSQLVLRDLEGRSVRPEEAPSIVAGFPHLLVSASRVGNPVLIP